MNLSDLLTALPSLSLADLQAKALVFGDTTLTALQDAQALRPGAQHRAQPVQLTDGRWMLSADLLSEVGVGGLYHDGFELLPSALFPSVEVLPWDDAIALLPPPPEMPLGVPE
jgi:hypothetical protein